MGAILLTLVNGVNTKMKNSLLFFSRLESLRGQRSKASFCRDIGVSQPLYQKWAGGSIPGGDKLKLIAKAGGVSVEWLLGEGDASVSLPPAPPSTPCRYPEACDLEAELGDVKERLAAMEGQLDTVIRLLGASLGSALPTHREHNQTQSHKAHPHRAAG
jgi:transcriptional regulator with XRE-family HTH domain